MDQIDSLFKLNTRSDISEIHFMPSVETRMP